MEHSLPLPASGYSDSGLIQDGDGLFKLVQTQLTETLHISAISQILEVNCNRFSFRCLLDSWQMSIQPLPFSVCFISGQANNKAASLVLVGIPSHTGLFPCEGTLVLLSSVLSTIKKPKDGFCSPHFQAILGTAWDFILFFPPKKPHYVSNKPLHTLLMNLWHYQSWCLNQILSLGGIHLIFMGDHQKNAFQLFWYRTYEVVILGIMI